MKDNPQHVFQVLTKFDTGYLLVAFYGRDDYLLT